MTSTVLAKRGHDIFGDIRLQQLWFATQRRSWRSLAIVSATPGLDTFGPTTTLAKMAWRYSGESTSVFDLRDVSLRLVDHQLREIHVRVSAGDRVFVALRSVGENTAAIPIARAVDALILCVLLGKTETSFARNTLETIGRERFLGTILADANGASPSAAVRGA